MKLKEFNFNALKNSFIAINGLCIMKDGKVVEEGFIGEVLRKIPEEFAELEIKDERTFFDIYVIEL